MFADAAVLATPPVVAPGAVFGRPRRATPAVRSVASGLAAVMLAVAAALVAGVVGTARVDTSPGVRDAPPFVLCGGAGVVGGVEPLLAAGAAPRPVPTVVSSHPLTDRPGKRITAVVVDFVPGAMSPPHRHGGDVSVYVLEGTVRSQLGTGPMETFVPGGTFFEPQGIIHTHSSNPSPTDHAKILAIFVHDEGATLTTYLE